jgi:hypothetical protein
VDALSAGGVDQGVSDQILDGETELIGINSNPNALRSPQDEPVRGGYES